MGQKGIDQFSPRSFVHERANRAPGGIEGRLEKGVLQRRLPVIGLSGRRFEGRGTQVVSAITQGGNVAGQEATLPFLRSDDRDHSRPIGEPNRVQVIRHRQGQVHQTGACHGRGLKTTSARALHANRLARAASWPFRAGAIRSRALRI